ncbi:MAG: flagellar biosynthesis anti-sigma factor FlgM [Betaproteobacteria bacterium]|jgi:negative regulator of flagellin synthesis FlgM
MKIGPSDPRIVQPPPSGERKTNATTRPDSAHSSAEVSLSSLAELKMDPNGEGSFDAAKVERITQAIREGTFTVNAGAIADQLISNAQELLDRTPQP